MSNIFPIASGGKKRLCWILFRTTSLHIASHKLKVVFSWKCVVSWCLPLEYMVTWQHNADPTFRWSVSCTAQIFHPKCLWPLPWSHNSLQVYRSVRALAALGAYLGINSLILRMKSDFSTHPLQDSPHSSKIFFRSFTFNFLRSTELRSTCLSRRR